MCWQAVFCVCHQASYWTSSESLLVWGDLLCCLWICCCIELFPDLPLNTFIALNSDFFPSWNFQWQTKDSSRFPGSHWPDTVLLNSTKVPAACALLPHSVITSTHHKISFSFLLLLFSRGHLYLLNCVNVYPFSKLLTTSFTICWCFFIIFF